MRAAPWRALAALATVVGATTAPSQASPIFGLRLSSRASMQWSADTLMVEGEGGSYQLLHVSRIDDVWMGPMRGAFVVLSDRGLGMLVGPTLAPSAQPFGARAVLRSSRPEAVFALLDLPSGEPHRRIVEWRSGDRQREVHVASEELVDFDVDVPGRLVMLTRGGRVYATDGVKQVEIPITAPGGPSGAPLTRVFVNADGSEVAVLAATALYRFDLTTSIWTRATVDPGADALVRHASSRRMRVEPRFVVTAR